MTVTAPGGGDLARSVIDDATANTTIDGGGLVTISGGNSVESVAQRIRPELESPATPALTHDRSTNTLIRRYRKILG